MHCEAKLQVSSPLEEVLQVPSVAEPCSAHTQVLHQAQVLGLVADDVLVKHSIPLEFIGLDAADVGRLLAHQDVHELTQAGLELRASLQGGYWQHTSVYVRTLVT